MKKILVLFLFLILAMSSSVYAESSYVLPYPSVMPGNRFYEVKMIWDEFKKYWFFGNFGQFKYNLDQSDNYLVEAKTLFEYKQYLLGYNALKKSDFYFGNIQPHLLMSKNEGRDITEKEKILKSAVQKHREVLNNIRSKVPNTFKWEPEKDLPTVLYLHKSIEEAISIRDNI